VYQNFASINTILKPVEKTITNTSEKIFSTNAYVVKYQTPDNTVIAEPQTPAPDNTLTAQPTLNIASLEQKIHVLINKQRQASGLSPLAFDARLSDIARAHSQDMIKNGYFDHVDMNGLDPHGRYLQAGYQCSIYTTGENMMSLNGYSGEEVIATDTIMSWMESSGHRENILDPVYQIEGIGISGIAGGKIYITEDFC